MFIINSNIFALMEMRTLILLIHDLNVKDSSNIIITIIYIPLIFFYIPKYIYKYSLRIYNNLKVKLICIRCIEGNYITNIHFINS